MVHATCYEKSTKLTGLKATNAFWNIEYYDPYRRTLTKPVMFRSTVKELKKELLALAHLALHSNRTLILPNVLLGTGVNIKRSFRPPASSNELNSARRKKTRRVNEQRMDMSHAPDHLGERYWPAFRTVQNTFSGLEVVEPAYYYRIQSDYKRTVPPPELLSFQLDRSTSGRRKQRSSTSDLSRSSVGFSDLLAAIKASSQHRLVLDLHDSRVGAWGPTSLKRWAECSFGDWAGPPSGIDKSKYVSTPYPKESLVDQNIIEKFRMCKTFLLKDKGNRTCFEKCM